MHFERRSPNDAACERRGRFKFQKLLPMIHYMKRFFGNIRDIATQRPVRAAMTGRRGGSTRNKQIEPHACDDPVFSGMGGMAGNL